MNNKRLVIGIISGALILVSLMFAGSMFEYVDNKEIVVIQDALDGELHVYANEAGYVEQWFGTPTHYKKSYQFWFTKPEKGQEGLDNSIKIRFSDGGHADISGSARINLPLDVESVRRFHIDFGSQEAIETQLIRTTMEKSIYMCGPLMSSKEASAEKRNDLLFYIEDGASNGVYKTKTTDVKIKDELSGQEKTISKVEIMEDTIKKIIIRQEVSPLKKYSIQLNTLSLKSIDYDDAVEKQIQQQQQLTMKVQTAMADARKAEQDAITVEKQGEANAATAKWKQEVLKAQAVTLAEQQLAVQKLATQTAELYKQQQILEGQGESEKKKLLMSADGALAQKLASLEAMTASWADGYAKRQVPNWYHSGGNGGGPDAEFTTFMNMMNITNAQKLGLDMTIPKGGNK